MLRDFDRSPFKRMKVLDHLHCLKADIAFLQETCLLENDLHHLRKLWVKEVWGSPAAGRKAEVAILIHKPPIRGVLIRRGSSGV